MSGMTSLLLTTTTDSIVVGKTTGALLVPRIIRNDYGRGGHPPFQAAGGPRRRQTGHGVP